MNASPIYPQNLHSGPESFNQVVGLEALLTAYGQAPEAQLDLIRRAYRKAEEAHKGQLRVSGAPYFCHVTQVALELTTLGLDAPTVAAGLLHDTVEDTPTTLEELQAAFGPDVAELVDGVTKISTRAFHNREEKQIENLRKMVMAIARDVRVLLIKLSDRLHNLRTLRYLPPAKQEAVARETLDLYAPLVHRLGIARWKWEIEDRCMQVLYPHAYDQLAEQIGLAQGDRQALLEEARLSLLPKLAAAGIEAEIFARSKHYWSIYQKMLTSGKAFGEIYDLMGLRVITRDTSDCYAALGVIHSLWKPLPGRVKDYIAMPKSNMYQSLHTTVIGPKAQPMEVQVRTREMHRTAEVGIAAHWLYKEGSAPKDGKMDERLKFFAALSDWQNNLRDTHEFMEFLKIDLYEDEVFVFTPKGEVKRLPKGSTPIDFAYAVHSNLGDQIYGSKVNGKMVPLRQELSSGDIIEVLTGPGHHPSKDWLHYVKTGKAKNRIRHWFKASDQEQFMDLGRELMDKELERAGVRVKDFYKSPELLEAGRRFSLTSIEDLLTAVGSRRLSPKHVLVQALPATALATAPVLAPAASTATTSQPEASAATPRQVRSKRKEAARRGAPAQPQPRGVVVKGMSNMLVTFARCCTPVPGDPILGFITIGRGVSVHRTDCVNVGDLSKRTGRLVEVAWAGAGAGPEAPRPVDLQVTGLDRAQLLSEMLEAIGGTLARATERTQMTAVACRSIDEELAQAEFTVQVVDLDHLRRVMYNLYQVEGITSVKRRAKVKESLHHTS
jgi:GTP pyrophosphokinase